MQENPHNLCLYVNNPTVNQVRDLAKIYLYRKNKGPLKSGRGIIYTKQTYLEDLGYSEELQKTPSGKIKGLTDWIILHKGGIPKFFGGHISLFERLSSLIWPERTYLVNLIFTYV